jgi:hypothetical protein
MPVFEGLAIFEAYGLENSCTQLFRHFPPLATKQFALAHRELYR